MQRHYITRAESEKVSDEGHYTVDFSDFKLDFFFRPSGVRRAIIMLPGFLDRARMPHPYFQRMKWLGSIEGAAFILTDPTLDLAQNVQIGWFIGNKKCYFLSEICEFFGDVLLNLQIARASTLFFGSSAGGHASIAFATHLKGSIAFAVNPQTDALRLHNAGELAAFLRAAFGSADLLQAEMKWGTRLKLVKLMNALDYVPRIYIWQNFYDTYHYVNHLLPFLNDLGTLKPLDQISVYIGAEPDSGHDPAGLEQLSPIFQAIFDTMRGPEKI